MTEEAQHRDEAAQNAANLQKRGGCDRIYAYTLSPDCQH
jgi:hypothetical protein